MEYNIFEFTIPLTSSCELKKSPESRSNSFDSGSMPPRTHLLRSRNSVSSATAPAGYRRTTRSESSDAKSVEKSNSIVGTEEYVALEHPYFLCGLVVIRNRVVRDALRDGPNQKETFYRIVTRAPDLTGEVTSFPDRETAQEGPAKRISAVREIKHCLNLL